jgi:hypothetical protein
MENKWFEVSLFALKSRNNIFKVNNSIFEFRVFKFKGSDNGFMTIWNRDTLNAFTVSRMVITEKILVNIIELDMDAYAPDNQYYLPKKLIFENSKPY